MIRTLLSAAVLGLGLTGAAQSATLFSDNFDDDILGTPQPTLLKWTVASGSIDVIGDNPFISHDFYSGNGNYLDMNGNEPGAIKTGLLGLVLSKSYDLSFNYGNNRNSNSAEELTFGIGNQLVAIAVGGATEWTLYMTSFVYDGGDDDYLMFADTGTESTDDRGGFIIDNVTLAAVPVPAAGLLLLGALGGLGALRRRKAV